MAVRNWRALGRKRAHKWLDRIYVPLDQARARSVFLRRIPLLAHRHGRRSYADWARMVGAVQTLLGVHLAKREGNQICDIGCGTGPVAIASEPFIGAGGAYVGVDVKADDIAFCRSHYPSATHSFVHLDVSNPSYAPAQGAARRPWPLADGRFDALTAMSVWTHLAEEDALFYLREVDRVLRPGGVALITFFLLDREYEAVQAGERPRETPHHAGSAERWIFDRPAYDSKDWLCARWARVPEDAIGVTEPGLARMLAPTRLRRSACYPGIWKGQGGIDLQDVLVLRKDA